ncbi:unnamed protein product, partial [Urochloa humidicola]
EGTPFEDLEEHEREERELKTVQASILELRWSSDRDSGYRVP